MSKRSDLPEGWVEKTLGDIGPVCMCKRIFRAQTQINGDIPFFKIGTFGNDPDAYIPHGLFEEYRQKYSYPKKGDVLISAAGTIGRTVIYNGESAYYQDSNIVWINNDETKVINKYLYYYYSLGKWAVPEGSTIARLYNDNISRTIICFPTNKSEQRAIAEVLSDMDGYIDSLEKLIVKKKAIKQGAMQKLLTGKRRLPGFSGEWVEYTLNDCFENIVGGGTPSRSNLAYWGNDIPWATVKDFSTFSSNSTQESITKLGLEKSASHLIPKGTPIIATRMGVWATSLYIILMLQLIRI